MPVKTTTVSLRIANRYPDGVVMTTVEGVTVPAPPPLNDTAAVDDWAYDYLFPHTGTGRTDGDAWYDIAVTAADVPALVGREFEYGY